MLAAFEDRYSTIVPFRNIVIVEVLSIIDILCKLDHENIKLEFVNTEMRDKQIANFKQWLTIKSNSI